MPARYRFCSSFRFDKLSGFSVRGLQEVEGRMGKMEKKKRKNASPFFSLPAFRCPLLTDCSGGGELPDENPRQPLIVNL